MCISGHTPCQPLVSIRDATRYLDAARHRLDAAPTEGFLTASTTPSSLPAKRKVRWPNLSLSERMSRDDTANATSAAPARSSADPAVQAEIRALRRWIIEKYCGLYRAHIANSPPEEPLNPESVCYFATLNPGRHRSPVAWEETTWAALEPRLKARGNNTGDLARLRALLFTQRR